MNQGIGTVEPKTSRTTEQGTPSSLRKQVTSETATKRDTLAAVLSSTVPDRLFPPQLELVPQLNEVYELTLAFYESQLLTTEELVRNGAYFARVAGQYTRHFLMCCGQPVLLPQHSSSRLRSFFKTNQFKTGYATHGLFPYRGKFHPQMIKGLINAMGLKPGETILDPMMGSGTVLIEASLMGIKSIGVDASPFCRFMAQAKLTGLRVPIAPLRLALRESEIVFRHFTTVVGTPSSGSKMRIEASPLGLFDRDRGAPSAGTTLSKGRRLPAGCESGPAHDFLLLAYLDSAGYAERSDRKSPYAQFQAILERYVFVVEKIQGALEGAEDELADAIALEGDARALPLEVASVDGILFSPPYSFAIDYLENDSFHLAYMGVPQEKLRESMIGLRGNLLREKYDLYEKDMDRVLSECSRVLRAGGICSVVVGTNSNQLAKIQGCAPEEVVGNDDLIVQQATRHGFTLQRKLDRQITGMANTMRTEFILMLRRN